tara:strand:- start:6954 stop:12728 length:5775 start_codon:yes stop_codon:yes gene_type:complete
MPLNKLENFIKNSEGRILYVNPNDLDATDGIENQGNSLTKPFKTLQRALLESARFSYLRGNDNDIVEKTTILLFPGEHLVDNRPGFGIKSESGIAKAISPAGTESGAQNTLTLSLNSNFDLTQQDNLLYKFNSTEGGVIVPRGTSIVGLDLRKTKIRPKYVPNPTDEGVKNSAIFRVTGACYFWQFTIFDGDETTLVYTDPTDFVNNQSKPVFSHHKLTVFEYADGVNKIDLFDGLTDLDVYYSKLSNAFNRASSREIDQKFPSDPGSFAKQRPEYEIVGAFQSDRIQISSIISGDGATPGQVVTVTTAVPHMLTGGTPIKIEGVNWNEYNISTKVQNVLGPYQFTYLLSYVSPTLAAGPAGGLSSGKAEVSVEVDTVTGASPYIFNCSLRSVYGMQGMKADGAKATGFKSMVVAQFTGVSLQKDDRAFVEYDSGSRSYKGIIYTKQTNELLSSESSSLDPDKVYHLNPNAVYRNGWKTAHITLENDAVLQIVSVFAIGYHIHFSMKSGGDASITNSNSNFGQFALSADGFKKESFDKDNKGFITSIIAPKAIVSDSTDVDLPQLDKHRNVAAKLAGNTGRLYLLGQINENVKPSEIAQGFRIGAKVNEKIYVPLPDASPKEAIIVMGYDNTQGTLSATTFTSEKLYEATHNDTTDSNSTLVHKLTTSVPHTFKNGESIRIVKENGDLPEGLDPHVVYYAITGDKNFDNSTQTGRLDGVGLSQSEIQIASSKTNAERTTPIYIKTIGKPSDGKLKIISRVSDKDAGDLGHPIQFDSQKYTVNTVANQVGGWFIHVKDDASNTIDDDYSIFSDDNEEIPYITRVSDDRSLDDKLYKMRYVIPKELNNGRDPNDSFILQESSSTNVRDNSDFNTVSIGSSEYDFNRNPKFISYLDYNATTKIVTIRADKSHNLNAGEQIIVKNVTCNVNQSGSANRSYNGTFEVVSIVDDKTFTYSTTDTLGNVHNVGTWSNDVHTRSINLPRFERNDNRQNLFIYRNEVITPYIEGAQDGVYHLYVLNGGNALEQEFTDLKYNQNVVNLYPELDRDNPNDNPQEAETFARRFPMGDVVTNDLKKSLTRESANILLDTFAISNTVSSVVDNTTNAVVTLSKEHKLSGLKYFDTLNGGSGHTPASGEKIYYNVKVFDDASAPSSAVWKGATATVCVKDGAVVASLVDVNGETIKTAITESGSGYTASLSPLYFDSSLPEKGGIGGAPSSNIVISAANISDATNDYVQVTGITTGTDNYFKINAVPTNNTINLKKTANEFILEGQQIISVGPVVEVDSVTNNIGTWVNNATFTCKSAHGLLQGNRISVKNSSDATLAAEAIVTSISDTDVKVFTADVPSMISVSDATNAYVLKHALSANDGNSGRQGENLGVRGVPLYDNDTLILNAAITTTDEIPVTLSDGATTVESISARFPLGSYLQVDSEIMRVVHSTIQTGTKLKVIRGALGTIVDPHADKSLIKKIKPLAIELRRPSILRASGHTFEYLGYGPGNYSTGLPQVQLKTLTQREEFLSQSQETSCGTVVYTGMNDKGDFYIGNTKISSDSGEQITFDIPVPTVTGEDPSQLSVVFDEVIIKDRLLVEGGSSQQILSQFNGPVTFNGNVRFNKDLRITKKLTVDGITKITNETESTSDCSAGSLVGAFTVSGGVAIKKRLNICGDTKIWSTTQAHESVNDSDKTYALGYTQAALYVCGGVGIGKNVYIGGTLALENALAANGGIHVPDGKSITLGDLDTTIDGTYYKGDLEIIHDGSNSIIRDIGEGDLYLQTAGRIILGNWENSKQGIVYNEGDKVSLYFDGIEKLKTSSDGVVINGDLDVTGDITAYFSPSDSTLKDNVTAIPNALDKVISISGNTFTWKEYRDQTPEGTQDTGVIAQEIEALGLPGLVRTNEDGHKSVSYQKLIPVLIEAIKELSSKVDALS